MHRKSQMERELVDQTVLISLGHVERMDKYRMARRLLVVEVSGVCVWGRPRLGWRRCCEGGLWAAKG